MPGMEIERPRKTDLQYRARTMYCLKNQKSYYERICEVTNNALYYVGVTNKALYYYPWPEIYYLTLTNLMLNRQPPIATKQPPDLKLVSQQLAS
jgi:hypothetical protein